MFELKNILHEEYKASFYNYILELKNGGQIMYNTKTGAVCIIDPKNKDTIINIMENPNNYKGHEFLENLVRLGYMVPSEKNELDDIRAWNQGYTKFKRLIHLTILPAEACNFTCPYCFIYENRNMFMKDWVYDAIYKYIEKTVKENEKKTSIDISWFGGEPTLAGSKIIDFMDRLNELKQKYSINMYSSLITNGYLLTADFFKKFLECGITNYQVTLDGDKDTHDRLRTLRSGAPTFDIIYNNLKEISRTMGTEKKFTFSIRANFMKSSLDSMEKLIARFASDFSGDDRFRVYFRPVYHFQTTRDDISPLTPDILSISEGTKIQNELAYKVLKADIQTVDMERIFNPLPTPTYSWCSGVRDNACIVGADGAIFSCDTLIVEKDKSVGELTPDGDIVLNENAKVWRTSLFDEKNDILNECMKCKIFPVCLGGCRRARLESNKKACFWSERDILNSMKEYAKLKGYSA